VRDLVEPLLISALVIKIELKTVLCISFQAVEVAVERRGWRPPLTAYLVAGGDFLMLQVSKFLGAQSR
jgi:hypothetical protein